MSWYPFSSNRSFGISSKVRIVTEAPEGEPPAEENYFSILKLLRKGGGERGF